MTLIYCFAINEMTSAANFQAASCNAVEMTYEGTFAVEAPAPSLMVFSHRCSELMSHPLHRRNLDEEISNILSLFGNRKNQNQYAHCLEFFYHYKVIPPTTTSAPFFHLLDHHLISTRRPEDFLLGEMRQLAYQSESAVHSSLIAPDRIKAYVKSTGWIKLCMSPQQLSYHERSASQVLGFALVGYNVSSVKVGFTFAVTAIASCSVPELLGSRSAINAFIQMNMAFYKTGESTLVHWLRWSHLQLFRWMVRISTILPAVMPTSLTLFSIPRFCLFN